MNNKFVECIKNSSIKYLNELDQIDILIRNYKISPKDLFMRFTFKESDIVFMLREKFKNKNFKDIFHFESIESFTVDLEDHLDKLLMDEYNLTALELHQMKRLDQELFNIMEDYFNASVNDIMYQNGALNRPGVEEEVFGTLTYEHDDEIKELRRELINESLKCCPLCKDKVFIYENFIQESEPKYSIFCNKCGLTTRKFKTEKELVKYWNTRS